MAKEKAVQYYVLNNTARANLGGVKIIERDDGNRTVTMTMDQARYWLDQQVIGTAPKQ